MLYECTNPIRQMVGVAHLTWNAQTVSVKPKQHSALSFRVKGDASVFLGKDTYLIEQNDILYMPQHTAYEAAYTDTEIFAIHFVTEHTDKQAEVYTPQNTEEVHRLFCQAYRLWQKKEAGFEVGLMSLVYSILYEVSKTMSGKEISMPIMTAVSYIDENYRDPDLTAYRICKAAGIGETTFRQVFKASYGKTPVEYITERRLEYARTLIAAGSTVENAACESGFRDPKYFARVVKKKLGCTPRELKLYGK